MTSLTTFRVGMETISTNPSNRTDGVTHTITEQRDELGRSVGYIYTKDGVTQQTVTISYAADGRIATAGFLHGGALKSFEYSYLSGSNLIEKLMMPNDMTLTQSYEPQRDLLIGMEYKRGDALVTQRSYAYDTLGRPLSRGTQYPLKDITHSDTFTHNSRSELVHAQLDDTMYGYDYDNLGNRRMAIEGYESAIYESNELNQYTIITENGDNFEPLFDAAGNQVLVKTNTGTWQITYNAENRPVQFDSSDGSTMVECSYDYMGRRCYRKVTVNGTVTQHQRYIYLGYLQIACCDLTRSATPCLWFILWDPTQSITTRPLAIQKNGVWYAYGWDLTKNICEIYGQTGYIRTIYTYSPGGIVNSDGDVTQNIQWSSEVYDDILGLVYYNYRYYNTKDGRWISRDTLFNPEHSNTYAYCDGIAGIDYLGEADTTPVISLFNYGCFSISAGNATATIVNTKTHHQETVSTSSFKNVTASGTILKSKANSSVSFNVSGDIIFSLGNNPPLINWMLCSTSEKEVRNLSVTITEKITFPTPVDGHLSSNPVNVNAPLYADDLYKVDFTAGMSNVSDDHEFTSIGIKCERKDKLSIFGNLSDTDFNLSGNLTLDPRDFDMNPKLNLNASANQKIYGVTVEVQYQYDAKNNSHAATASVSWVF